MTEIFSSGGGTQSACVAVLIIQGRLPRPDWAVIVDTGRERSAVWEYHESIVKPALAKAGVEIHRVHKDRYTGIDIFSGKTGNTLMIPAFTNQTGEVGKLSNFCSHEWKMRVRQRFMREMGVKTKDQRNWICFSIDEARRAVRLMASEEYQLGRIRMPVIHDIPLRREAAIAIVEAHGWPTPPRSACWMCPNASDAEWIDLKNNWPADFQRAVELERDIRLKDPFAFLHSSCVPLDEVDFSSPSDLFERACGSGNCFV